MQNLGFFLRFFENWAPGFYSWEGKGCVSDRWSAHK